MRQLERMLVSSETVGDVSARNRGVSVLVNVT